MLFPTWHANGLAPSEVERLSLLVQQGGKLVAAAGTLLREGFIEDGQHAGRGANRKQLAEAAAGTIAALSISTGGLDFGVWNVMEMAGENIQNIDASLNHNAMPKGAGVMW